MLRSLYRRHCPNRARQAPQEAAQPLSARPQAPTLPAPMNTIQCPDCGATLLSATGLFYCDECGVVW